jgi:DNA-binding MarR family transcriptional regulator
MARAGANMYLHTICRACWHGSGLRVTQLSILATVARMGEANSKRLEDRLTIDQTTPTRRLTDPLRR